MYIYHVECYFVDIESSGHQTLLLHVTDRTPSSLDYFWRDIISRDNFDGTYTYAGISSNVHYIPVLMMHLVVCVWLQGYI